MKKNNKMLCLLLILLLTFYLCTTVVTAQDETFNNILKENVVKIGFCVDTPPMKFRDTNGEITGICADLSKAIARDLGVELEYVFSDWGGLIPNLLSGRSDLIVGDMAVTTDRSKKVIFTDPWIRMPGSITAVMADSEWESVEDLNKESVKIGVILGARGQQMAKAHIPKATISTYDSNTEQTLSLKQGRIDAIINEKVLMEREVAQSEGLLRILGEPLEYTAAHIALRSDDYRLWFWLNDWLFTMERSGELKKLLNYWIETNEWEKDYPEFASTKK